jgi:hypothetical protein
LWKDPFRARTTLEPWERKLGNNDDDDDGKADGGATSSM